jgi:hypothetical protein
MDNPVIGRIVGSLPCPSSSIAPARDHAWNRPIPKVTTPTASNNAAR